MEIFYFRVNRKSFPCNNRFLDTKISSIICSYSTIMDLNKITMDKINSFIWIKYLIYKHPISILPQLAYNIKGRLIVSIKPNWFELFLI